MKKSFITLTILYCLSTSACMTTPALPDEQRPIQWGTSLDKQHNFYQISNHVFRSEQPSQEFIPQLQHYKIQNIINLRQSKDDFTILENQPYNIIHIPIRTWVIDREDMLQVMKNIKQIQQRGENVLIHCYHGSDRTGASIAMYRILFENWTIEQATQEMKHGGYGFHSIWKNIEHLFTEENITWIRQRL